MRIAAIVLTLVLCSAARAEIPIVPAKGAPDYEMTIVERWGLDGLTNKRVAILHHAGRVRGDFVSHDNRTTVYSFGETVASLTITSRNARQERSLVLARAAKEASGWNHERTATGLHESFLGEACEVWKTGQSTNPGSDQHRLECVTADGITLWSRFIGKQGVTLNLEATSLTRRPVSADEVRLPADWFDPKSWFDVDRTLSSNVPVNHRVELRLADASLGRPHPVTRIKRQFGSWSYDEGVRDEGRRAVSIWNPQTGLSLDLEVAAGGAFQRLNLSRAQPSNSPVNPVEINMKDNVLGEDCRWFNMTPHMADISRGECRTADGVVLKEQQSGWGVSGPAYTAVALERGRVTLNEVLPSESVFLRGNWGIPD